MKLKAFGRVHYVDRRRRPWKTQIISKFAHQRHEEILIAIPARLLLQLEPVKPNRELSIGKCLIQSSIEVGYHGDVHIVISSNCMTGGLTASLRIIFPRYEISPLPYSAVSESGFTAATADADVILFSGPPSSIPKSETTRIITFPELYFNAFHPDQVYAWMPDGTLVEGATGPYNSAIVLWAWQNQLSANQAIDLFQPEIMARLGYHDRWSMSMDRLRHDFTGFPHLDYRDFIDPLRRSGCFMHTVNHPKVSAIARMARLLAHQIDPNVECESIPLEDLLVDSLFNASFAWAVYPSVANSLGLTSEYRWKREDHSVIGLEEFVINSFDRYDTQQPRDVDCHELKWPIYDQVLSDVVQGGAR